MAKKVAIEVGAVFGRLIVIGEAPAKGTNSCSNCRCQCGSEVVVRNYCLRNGHTRSCGCLNRDETGNRFRKHGKAGSKLYDVWMAMRKRCENPDDPAYHRYGGRGIVVCDEWKTFEVFYADMGDRSSPRHTLERKDNSKGYCKENCVWATYAEQANNRRNTRRLTIDGVTKTMADWCREYGADYYIVHGRIKRGWDARRALSAPIGTQLTEAT